MIRSGFVLSWLLVFFVSGYAKTIYVPQDFSTIQAALDATAQGDTILVAPGTYEEHIDFSGKAVKLSSLDGPETTKIRGDGSHCVVTFASDEGPDSVLTGFTLNNGSSTLGGGIHCTASSPTIENNIIKFNVSTFGWGGGIYCYNASPIISNNVIEKNESNIGGGGIYCVVNSSPAISGNIISCNKSTHLMGGGILCEINSSPVITNNTLEGNKAYQGAGICCIESSPDIEENLFIEQSGLEGVGIYCIDGSSAVIRNNTILDSIIKGDGGAVSCYKSSPVITGNRIVGNTCLGSGGGIECIDSAPVICNNVIAGNTSQGSGCGITCSLASSPVLVNNVIHGNSALVCGAGIWCGENTNLSVFNTILWDNQAPVGSEIWVGRNAAVTVDYSNVKGGLASTFVGDNAVLDWGSAMMDSDPCFVDPGEDDFHILHTSPCRNSGDNSATGIPEEDFDGNPRINDGTVDIGADEFCLFLYYTGTASPGSDIEVKLMETPAAGPVLLWVGSDVLEPPLNTAYGDWYLEFPLLLTINLGFVPADGKLAFPFCFPLNFPVPMEIPLQAFTGAGLSNLCRVEVK